MACDICSKTGTALVDLRDIYKTEKIQAICPECEKAVNDHLSKLQGWTSTLLCRLLKKFMQVRAARGGAA